MKKKFLTAFVLTVMSFSAMAQSDGFFSSRYSQYEEEYRDSYIHIFSENTADFLNMEGAEDLNVPIGNGLLVLSCAGLIYAFSKRKENEI